MCAVRLAGLAFLAESDLAIALNGEGCRLRCVLCREEAVAVFVRSRAGRCEHSGCVGPVEEEVENDSEEGGCSACVRLATLVHPSLVAMWQAYLSNDS